VGEEKTSKIRIRIIDYDQAHLEEKEAEEVEEAFPFKDKPTITWINVDGLQKTEVIEKIGKLDHFFYRIDDVCRNIQVFQLGEVAYIPKVLLNHRIYMRKNILKFRIRTLFEFYILINRFFKGYKKYLLFIKQTIFQIIKFSFELFSYKK